MHLVVAALFVGFVWLGWWQWGVGSDPNADDSGFGGHYRNLTYAVQWWFIACFGLWFWSRFLRDQRKADEAYEAEWLAAQQAAAEDPAAASDLPGDSVAG